MKAIWVMKMQSAIIDAAVKCAAISSGRLLRKFWFKVVAMPPATHA
jgi:hypothetical protein